MELPPPNYNDVVEEEEVIPISTDNKVIKKFQVKKQHMKSEYTYYNKNELSKQYKVSCMKQSAKLLINNEPILKLKEAAFDLNIIYWQIINIGELSNEYSNITLSFKMYSDEPRLLIKMKKPDETTKRFEWKKYKRHSNSLSLFNCQFHNIKVLKYKNLLFKKKLYQYSTISKMEFNVFILSLAFLLHYNSELNM